MFVAIIFGFAGAFTLLLLYVALVWLPREMHEAYRGAFRTLAMAVEERQPIMAGHSARVAELAVTVASRLGLPAKSLQVVEYAALLHDIGKVSIPYLILNSKDALSPQQEARLREHAEEGAGMLVEANTMKEIVPLVMHHHRRYDELLSSQSLPSEKELLLAQIVAVSNAMDSMLHGTGGYPRLSRSQAIGALWQGSGTLYHPRAVEVITKLLMDEPQLAREPEPAEIAA